MNSSRQKMSRVKVEILLAAFMLSACADGSAAPERSATPLDNHVTISSGSLSGNPADASGIISFKGIPYAAAPVGELRWKEPQPPQSWNGVRDATDFGARCWAATAFGGPVVTEDTSEDCLYLNVWSGAKTRADKLPVMVWIHPGGFQFASASDALYGGSALAKKDVLVVSMNYRLGVLGFLSRPDLDAESKGHKSGMYGIQDQIAALRWVQDNIAAFGGDPNNVTVFGESAGAHAVGLLMASPLAKGLFHKAIGQSGAFWESEDGAMKPYDDAQTMGLELGTQLGAATLDELRAVPPLQLQTATDWTFATNPQVTAFSPIVDGYVLPEDPYVRFVNGRQNDVPLLAGWNADEGLPFLPRSLPHDTLRAYTDAATEVFGAANLERFLELYPASSALQAAQSAQALIGDQTIKYQTWGWVTQHQKTGRSPVYVYNFSYTSPFNPVATHLTDVQYVFGTLLPNPQNPATPSQEDRALSETMQTYWSNFARAGSPNGSGLPDWPQYGGAGSQALQIGNEIGAGPEEGTARFLFLDKFRVDGLITLGSQQAKEANGTK